MAVKNENTSDISAEHILPIGDLQRRVQHTMEDSVTYLRFLKKKENAYPSKV